jgi:hypothetical protein
MAHLVLCVGAMTKQLATVVLMIVAGCADGSSSTDLAPDRAPQPAVPGKSDAICPTVNAGFVPQIQAPHLCGPLDSTSQSLTGDVNRFWNSQVGFCACGPDYPDECLGATAHGGGWVYANLEFVADLRTSGSDMPAAYVYAHEFGHEIQGYLDAIPPVEQKKELQADCLAGYYLGSLSCRGITTIDDVRATLATACVLADGTGDPIRDRDTHGTCEQRARSVAIGMDAYLAGEPALSACSI